MVVGGNIGVIVSGAGIGIASALVPKVDTGEAIALRREQVYKGEDDDVDVRISAVCAERSLVWSLALCMVSMSRYAQ